MPVSSARAAAFDILLQVELEDAYASELLNAPRYQKLSTADHGLATELVMGVLRWRAVLDDAIAAASSVALRKLDREVLTALRLAAYQIRFLERVPQRAAVHESVELVKRARKGSAAPFANAVLRKLTSAKSASEGPAIAATTLLELARQTAHPAWIVERWASRYGYSACRQICEYDQRVPETTIRVFDPEAVTDLRSEGVDLGPASLLTAALRVRSRDITKTRAFKQGLIAIQDEGSQLVALLAGKGKRILDCCAAPGGKTRILAHRNPGAEIVAMELHEHRARLLRSMVSAANVQVVTGDVRQLPVKEHFDRVLVDVPCSGTGTLARNPEIKWKLKLEDLTDLRTRQLAILRAAMNQIASGGRLVYSTCSLEREENTAVVEEAISGNGSFQILPCEPELRQLSLEGELSQTDRPSLTSGPYLQTLPGVHGCDGFFAAILRRD